MHLILFQLYANIETWKVFISVLTIQWITAKDGADTGSTGGGQSNSTGESRNDRTLIRPEKPVMTPMKKKRRSTDFSDDFDDMDMEMETNVRRDTQWQGLGSGSGGGHDGSADTQSPSSTASGEAGLNAEAIKQSGYNAGLTIQKRLGKLDASNIS